MSAPKMGPVPCSAGRGVDEAEEDTEGKAVVVVGYSCFGDEYGISIPRDDKSHSAYQCSTSSV